ncbi:hypothetical protein FF1_038879 [Malus domestica]
MKTLNNIVIFIFIMHFLSTVHGEHEYDDIVLIVNRLGGGTKLKVHCKTEDDDFGLQILEDGHEVQWWFRRNFFGNTLIYCFLQWKNSPWYTFDAYSRVVSAFHAQVYSMDRVRKLQYHPNGDYSERRGEDRTVPLKPYYGK